MSPSTATHPRLGAILLASLFAVPFACAQIGSAPSAAPAVAVAAAATPFANPSEVGAKNHTLKAVMMMSDADRTVPGGGTKHLRYFQGWQFDDPSIKSPKDVAAFSPGPTLRARVGDKVDILFLNKVNDDNFAYTFVTAEGKTNPSYGCDQTSNLAVYPAKDRFPNCFHGSSTANLHFHGTHVTPNALGDNVLIQVMPDRNVTQDLWKKTAQEIFDRRTPATTWEELPDDYRTRQQALVKAIDPHLWMADEQQIKVGQFPQYVAGAFTNSFVIPDYDQTPGQYDAGQSPGTQWYHAHKHGSTALHTLNGLAGLFIIEGPYDDFIRNFYGLGTAYKPEFEKLIVLQSINPDLDLQRTRAQGPATTLVNGLSQPTITMEPGEVQLWRLVNATAGAGGGVQIKPSLFTEHGFALVQTAQDGVQFSRANVIAQPNLHPPKIEYADAVFTLAGGNRADLLVRAPLEAGTTPFGSAGTVLFNVTVSAAGKVKKALPCEPVEGTTTPADNCWPAMPKYLQDLAAPNAFPHHVAFGWDAEPNRTAAGRLTSNVGINLPPKFTIDNKQFEEFGPLVDQCMPLSATQDWILENNTTTTHPYHIHINPFQVVKIETPAVNKAGAIEYTTTAPAGNLLWQDVVAIPPAALQNGIIAQGRVTIRQHYADFAGTFVLHCHILAHEDRGMMQLVRIVPADKFPGDCQQAIPHHH